MRLRVTYKRGNDIRTVDGDFSKESQNTLDLINVERMVYGSNTKGLYYPEEKEHFDALGINQNVIITVEPLPEGKPGGV